MTEAEQVTPKPKKSVALSGIPAGNTALCTVGRTGNDLHYRGYDILDFAEDAEFEEVAYLLVHEKMPTKAELAGYKRKLKAQRGLPTNLKAVLEWIPASAHPMDVLRTSVSALSAFDPETRNKSPEATLRKGIRLTAQVPMIVAAHEHIRNGREPVAPDPRLAHAANFLYMLKGKAPGADAARLMDIDMVLHAEHGSNASSFAARVVAGTDADLHGAI
ncbi:MAG: citrate/2-methylcitrate synthase, partial [Methylocella sp.]